MWMNLVQITHNKVLRNTFLVVMMYPDLKSSKLKSWKLPAYQEIVLMAEFLVCVTNATEQLGWPCRDCFMSKHNVVQSMNVQTEQDKHNRTNAATKFIFHPIPLSVVPFSSHWCKKTPFAQGSWNPVPQLQCIRRFRRMYTFKPRESEVDHYLKWSVKLHLCLLLPKSCSPNVLASMAHLQR
jgi:hypothetical protein